MTFVLASLVVLAIAILTISIQTFRAVRSDPATSLRDLG
jgi:hypothetical protein